jgi:ATP-dependent RNA helicase DeaD
MHDAGLLPLLGAELCTAFDQKGYAELTSVQRAVLDPALAGRDLRITSQTGSGKTVAIGLALRSTLLAPAPVPAQVARPVALIVAPTRELARQTQAELAWLFAGYGTLVVSITGGTSYRDEHRDLRRSPRIVVGTPGRLLDHLGHGSLDGSLLATVVLDEADRLLDMGFRDDLDKILAHAPATRRTHLVSATFPHAVRALADRVQPAAAHVQGTRLGVANTDIDHVLHLVEPSQRADAVINLVLDAPDARTLVFVRTRADVANLTADLVHAGIAASALSGELDQAARNRALETFRAGRHAVLVATDVAARGLDVPEVTRVIHGEPPTNPDAYTHRAGRTGRAGRKGRSCLLVTLGQLVQATRLLRAAGIAHRFEPVPSAESIRRAADERVYAALTAESSAAEGDVPVLDRRAQELARRLLGTAEPERVVARLLVRSRYAESAEPREIRQIAPPDRARPRSEARGRARERDDTRDHRDGPEPRGRARAPDRTRDHRDGPETGFVPFEIAWGGVKGAEPRKLVAMLCRRGDIRGTDIGAIHVEAMRSVVEVAASVAEKFARNVAKPGPRGPRVTALRRAQAEAPQSPRADAGERRPKRPGPTRSKG